MTKQSNIKELSFFGQIYTALDYFFLIKIKKKC